VKLIGEDMSRYSNKIDLV